MRTGKRKKKNPCVQGYQEKAFRDESEKKKKKSQEDFCRPEVYRSIHEKELLFHDSSCATIWFWALLRS